MKRVALMIFCLILPTAARAARLTWLHSGEPAAALHVLLDGGAASTSDANGAFDKADGATTIVVMDPESGLLLLEQPLGHAETIAVPEPIRVSGIVRAASGRLTARAGDGPRSASQVWPAGLDQKNQIVYTTKRGLPTFASPSDGDVSGQLYIRQDRRVEAGKSRVGLALSGLPAYTVPAQPNVDLIFTPKLEYWVTFGEFAPGEVLDLQEITNAAPVVYPPNCYAINARLNADNLWTIDTIDTP